ncbi:MAG TPA: response regulator transcription factor [bacterium]|nr:response regulator transcription factor [bacterium]
MNPPDKNSIRILVVDDHFFTRMGLAAALNLESDMGVVAEAATGREAIALYREHRPDVAVLDCMLPDMHGAEVAREIVSHHDCARLLMFSVEETEEDIHRAVNAGVRGYLPKSAPRPELLSAVRTVAAGRRFFPEPVLGKLHQRRSHVSLSAREIEVLQAMAEGLPNKLIALRLGVSTETVKTFVGRILEKLGAEDRTQAVMVAIERGVLRRK